MIKLFIGLMIVLTAVAASAATLASWEFTGATGLEATADGAMAGNMEQSILSHGAGLGYSTANADSFNGTGFLSTLTAALAADDYFTFNLEAAATYAVSVSSIDFNFDASGSGPQSWALFSSVTGFNEGDVLNNWISVGPSSQTATLSGVPELQDVTAGAIEFRIYGYEASLQAGTGSFEGAGDDITVNGAVIPEPATMSLLGIGALVMFLRRRKEP